MVREVVKKKAEYTSRQTKKKGVFFRFHSRIASAKMRTKKVYILLSLYTKEHGSTQKKKKLEKNEAQNQISVEEALE